MPSTQTGNQKENFNRNRKKFKKYEPAGRRILQEVFGAEYVIPDDPKEDTKHNTDFWLKFIQDHKDDIPDRIGFRCRSFKFNKLHGEELTIRCFYRYGETIETELKKILEGKYGDLILYVFVKDDKIFKWRMLNYDAFRKFFKGCRSFHYDHVERYARAKGVRCGIKTNQDGTGFIWFDLVSFMEQVPNIVPYGSQAPAVNVVKVNGKA